LIKSMLEVTPLLLWLLTPKPRLSSIEHSKLSSANTLEVNRNLISRTSDSIASNPINSIARNMQ